MAKQVTASFQDMTTFQKLWSIQASIDQVKGLATVASLELNRNQCQHLNEELQKTAKFLHYDDARTRILGYESTSSRLSKALLQLYSVVKRAENLVQQCWGSKDLTWPRRALTLFSMKDDALDIIIHVRWWTSILSMLIDVPRSKSSKLERLVGLNQKFEQRLESSDELQKAAEEDRKLLLKKVIAEIQAYSDHGNPKDYLFLLQVHTLLTGKDEHSTPKLNIYTHEPHNALVGQGGFGVVHRVRWYGYACVLKQYDCCKPDDTEVKSLKRFHHPHIVRYFRHWKDETTEKSHILMERMEEDLEQHIKSVQRKSEKTQPFSLPVAIDIMLQVMNAVWRMHNKDTVHRDLKPKNVLVRSGSENGILPELSKEGYVEVKLGDFGLAKADMMTSNAGALTHKAGTTLYRAPELALQEYTSLGTRKFPRKIDMWSFGIMCSQILTGERPFKGLEGNNAVQAYIEKGGRPSLRDDCPDYLRFCIKSCWEKNPEKRPRSSDMWRMLRVAQLRSLGIIGEELNELFTFKDHKKNQVSLIPPVKPQGEGSGSDFHSQQPSDYQSNPNYYSDYRPSQSYAANFRLVDHNNQPILNPNYLKKIRND